MIGEVTNHLWQSTWFAAAAGLLTLGLRRNRAKVRYWLWFSASVKFVVPFAVLMSIGSRVEWRAAANKVSAAPAISVRIVELSQPFSESGTAVPATQARRDWRGTILFGVWTCGFAAVAWIRFRGWRRIRAAVRASRRIDLAESVEARAAPGLLEPGVVGWRRPVLLLPEGIAERLTRPQMEAVLAHELCHVRRRDNLLAAIHMAVEGVFWFHPLVWWIGARLVEERERACDEEVLRLGNEPHEYAQAILNICKLYAESPLVCVSGVTGSDLKKRIQAILSGGVAGELSFVRKAGLAAAGMFVVAMPIIVGMLNAPRGRAQAMAGSPKFEVASIKPCKQGEGPLAGKGPQKKGGGGGPSTSPDRLTTPCFTVEELILSAYVRYANGYQSRDPSAPPVEGGPDWIRSDRYQVTAKAEGLPGQGVMNGQMMRSLLEDRMHVKIRREMREVPVYALTVARGGPKLKPFQEGSCAPLDMSRMIRPLPENSCHVMVGRSKGANQMLEAPGTTLDDVARLLYLIMDRPVTDRTGIAGRFDIYLEFAPQEGTPAVVIGGGPPSSALPTRAADEPSGPSIFEAMEKQLGLKLLPAKGPREFVVIEHVERPTEN